ncbi:hypothetical protein [Micromonospora sediminicola]|uniref:hypothetical protein n=1 Tax=Micromonospora sediminicola TaxID=946078 RepID=UPI000B138B44|nr:hypothetical protein [Micromonospora sediminicola]
MKIRHPDLPPSDRRLAASGEKSRFSGLVSRLDRAGFGHLLRPDVIDAARRRP